MSQIGKYEFGFNDPATPGDRTLRIALLLDDLAGGFRQRPEFRQQLLGAALLGLAVVPGNLQGVTPGLRRPKALGVDRDAGRNLSDVDDARNRLRGGRIERGYRPAEPR